MKVMIGCGGTGGHITPAIAIADIIQKREPDAKIRFLGALGGMEERMVRRAGYPIKGLQIVGLSRKLTLANARALYLAMRAVGEAARILDDFSPDIVIGTGGYASYPALRAAVKRGIPAAVHESNAIPGLTVRRLARDLDRVWLNFERAGEALPKGTRVMTVGLPLPRDYAAPRPVPLPKGRQYMVLSFGGSLGARELNRAVLTLMEAERDRPDVYHLHATGEREYGAFCEEFKARGLDRAENLKVVPFLTPMSAYMSAAHVVICRAGAASISELSALARPAVLIPSPNVTGNHQYHNADALSRRGAAILIEESESTGKQLTKTVAELLENGEKRQALSRAISAFSHPRVNDVIYEDICALCRKKGK